MVFTRLNVVGKVSVPPQGVRYPLTGICPSKLGVLPVTNSQNPFLRPPAVASPNDS